MSQPTENMHPTALDSDAQQVGVLYGKAILSAAGSDADEIVQQLNAIVQECIVKHPGLEHLLASPRVSQVEKEQLIDRIFRGRVHSKLLNFLKIMCRRGRIGSLRAVGVCANEMRDQQLGRIRASVTTALPLTDELRQAISARLGQSLGKQVMLDERVDESLLGGILIRVGDQVYDGSVQGKISAVRGAVSQGIQKAVRDRLSSLLSP